MRTLVFIIFSFMLPSLAFSQADFKPAYIVKNNGDTIKGFIQEGDENKLSQTITFKKGIAETKPEYFSTADVRYFGFDGGNTFKNITYNDPSENQQVASFCKLLLKGYNSLYSFIRNDRIFYVVQKIDSTYLLYDINYTISGQVLLEGNFRNMLLFLSGSCTGLKNSLEKISYADADMINYIRDINRCLAPTTANEVVFKKAKMATNIVAYAGGLPLAGKPELTGRLIARFTLPSVDRKSSLNIGINYMYQSKTEYVYIPYPGNYLGEKSKQTVVNNTISVPVTIQYYFTGGKLRPYFDGGVCYVFRTVSGVLNLNREPTTHHDNGPSYVIAAGIDYNITQKLFIKAEIRRKLLFHYPTVGVSYLF